MKRFFIPHSEITKDHPQITGQEAQHISRVFRLKSGDAILLIDGTGLEYTAEITGISKTGVNVRILRQAVPPVESALKIAVGQGYLKDKKMDVLVRHLTEIGIAKWMPVTTEFSVPQPKETKTDPRVKRWESIAIEAAKQCGRTRIPEILPPAAFSRVLEESSGFDLKMIFHEKEPRGIAEIADSKDSAPASVFILFGPEGGFSADEIRRASSLGFCSASMGPRVLRAETASIAGCTLVQHLFGDMR
jgi:16S rRNA (uracil1498-N3)-methyltransferase